MNKTILLSLVSAALILSARADFTWRTCIPDGGLSAAAASNSVTLTLSGRGVRCGGDGYVAAAVPLLERGQFDFDLRITPPERNRAMSHFLTLYGIRVFWHDGCRDWRVIFPEPNANRETGFHDEPVRHHQIAKFTAGTWHHCRIAFDAPGDRVEFFLDDMGDPAYIAGNVSVWREAEFEGGELKIGGMGLSGGSVGEFRNLTLVETKANDAAVARTETLIFNGMASEYYGVDEFLAADGPQLYLLDFTRYCYMPRNCYKYSKLPGVERMRRAKRIVLVDAPVSYDHVLPDFILKDIATAAHEGAEVIFLDGPFALERGEYAGTALERILPEGTLAATAFPPLRTTPEILTRAVGKGTVKVFRGLRFGADPKEFRARFVPWAAKLFGNR